MKLNSKNLVLMPILRGFGLNCHVRGWNRALSALFPLYAQTSEEIEIRKWGVNYAADPTNYIDWMVLVQGEYEKYDLDFISRHAAPGSVCLDIGANVGHHSIYFATLGFDVHAFEPNPALWERFRRKIQKTGLTNVSLHPVGLGEADAELLFEVENVVNSGTGRFVLEPTRVDTSAVVGSLTVCHGDKYVDGLFDASVGLIKIDVQGFESAVLRGLQRTIASDRPLLCIEIGEDNVHELGQMRFWLGTLPAGYRFFQVLMKPEGIIRRWTVVEIERDPSRTLSTGNLFCLP